MSTQVGHFESQRGGIPGLREAADLADAWLFHAASSLFDACDVPEDIRQDLLGLGLRVLDTPDPRGGVLDETSRLEHLDASRLALLFAALALESRLNYVLRRVDESDWRAICHLSPAERLGLIPRLLHEPDATPRIEALSPLVAELFDIRDELVEGGASAGAAARYGPSRARVMVEASAKTCRLLATLSGGVVSPTADRVQWAARALAGCADSLSLAKATKAPPEGWAGEIDFPPDLAEWNTVEA